LIQNKHYFFTSESVTEGHPDKIADQISDAILDEILADDPSGRVAAETTVATGLVLVVGQITTKTYVDIPSIIRKTIKEVGYTRAKYGFDSETCAVLTSIDPQSSDIAGGVNVALEKRGEKVNAPEEELGAGDQGMVYGFACDETEEFMPLPIILAHNLAKRLAFARKNRIIPFLRPDGKTQVTVEYEGYRPIRVDTVLISSQHKPDVDNDEIEREIIEKVIMPVIPENLRDGSMKILINPSGRFVIGGPQGDSGLTGRKIIVDTYGGMARHGGGAFSGKDPTKVDRSGAYYARYVAKNIVAAGLAARAEIQVSYAIGKANPLSIMIDTFGTNNIPEERIEELVREIFDFRPRSIINQLDLRRPIYRPLAAYGHMGRVDLGTTWEKLDKIEELKKGSNL
jgi:S-adenosylmethionine synthetase